MKIALFVNTPAQAHFVRNIARNLKVDGHEIYVLSRDYGETLSVLNELGIMSKVYSRPKRSKLSKVFNFPVDVFNACQILRNKSIDIIFGFGINETYTGLLIKKPVIIFTDSEPMVNKISYSIQYKIWLPFASAIITPSSFREDLSKRHIKVNSYKELAYLHANYYKPNPDIFRLLGITAGEEYIILRFNAFDAVHDIGISGFSDDNKIRLVKELKKYAKVFISSEAGVPEEIKDEVMKLPKSRIHDALYYADLIVTDTQTIATEGAILGTPTIRCNAFAGDNDMSNFIELEQRYNLILNYNDPDKAISKAIELIQKQDLKEEWKVKKGRLLEDKIDINTFIIWFIENYPESFEKMKKDNER